MSRKSLRYKAVQRMLALTGDELYADCHWCGIRCIWWQKLDKDTVLNPRAKEDGGVKILAGMVRFMDGDKKCLEPIVTVDHVQELSRGGTNDPNNIVLSCVKCNSARSSRPLVTYKECLICGAEHANKRKFCVPCNRGRQEQYLKESGLWDEAKHAHRFSRDSHFATMRIALEQYLDAKKRPSG